MIILDDFNAQTRSDVPNEDWTNGKAKYVVEDDTPLADKIMAHAPNFEPVEDENGNLIDIIPLPEPSPPNEEQIAELEAEIQMLCAESMPHSLHIQAGTGTDFDMSEVQRLNNRVTELENQIAELKKSKGAAING
jgi:hypothetical protein